MSISIYSIVMAIIWFSLAALIGSSALRKSSKGGLIYVSVIFILAILRIFIPLDLESSIIIRSKYWYPFLQDFVRKPLLGQITIGYLLLITWAVGSVFNLARLVKNYTLLHKFRINSTKESVDSKIKKLSLKIANEFDYTSEIYVTFSPNVSTAYQAGFAHPFILLPSDLNTFTDEQICCMLRHELCHFLGKDLWIKAALQIMTCILWWNPAIFLLNQSIEHMLELRCDQRACKQLTKESQIIYLETLLVFAEANSKKAARYSLGYTGVREDYNITQRFKLILDGNARTFPNAKIIFSIIFCCISFFISYSFIIQPWTPPATDFEQGATVVNLETSYLIHVPSDQYELYIDGEYIGILDKEKIAQKPFCDYYIYEGGLSNEETQISHN